MFGRLVRNDAAWLVIFVTVVLLLPVILGRTGLSRTPFDQTPSEELEKLDPPPEVVLIGDSMLGTRIVPDQLSELSEAPVFVNILEGSASARWYLYLKNHLARLDTPPKHVVIFFRDRYLTDPTFRTSAQYQELLHATMQGEEPLVEALLEGSDQSRFGWLAEGFEWLYPSQQLRDSTGEYVVERAQKLTENMMADGDEFNVALDRTFEIDLLRSDMPSELASENLNQARFDASPEKSFLPHMVAIAKKNGWHLTFYRVKRRPQVGDIRTDEPEMKEYIQDLRAYLEANGATLVDETSDETIGIEYYSDGDHVAEEMQGAYTARFFERFKELFK